MADADINARELVQRLWEQAEGELLSPEPVVPELPEYESPEHDGNLRYLNTHWTIDPMPEGPGSGSAIKDRAKDRMTATVLGVLDRYFEREREYLAHGVRFSNRMAEWGGRMAREIRLVQRSLADESRRLAERQDILHRRLEQRVEELERRLAELEGA
jgi:hypothetical protein